MAAARSSDATKSSSVDSPLSVQAPPPEPREAFGGLPLRPSIAEDVDRSNVGLVARDEERVEPLDH